MTEHHGSPPPRSAAEVVARSAQPASRASRASGKGGSRKVPIAIGLIGLVLISFLLARWLLDLRQPEPETGLVFTIPAGASATVARPGFDSAIAIPTDIRFVSPADAVITVHNLDTVQHRAGPFLVGAGQTYVQRFPEPGRYPIVCTVDPLETVVVTVEG